MANLYLTEQNSVLRKTGDRLLVEKDDQILLDVQCHKIQAVLIFGNVQFTTQAVHELMEHGIELAIHTRSGKLVGQLTSPTTKNIALRIKQFARYEEAAFRLRLAREIVGGKISNCLHLMREFAYNHPEIDLQEESTALKTQLPALATAAGLDQVLGQEGEAAKVYFQGFAKMLLGEFVFPGRRKRPPPDPVNAILSLSYTMIFNEIGSLLDGLGFDPYLGYLHSATYGRASLAADLMEEFRAPVADRLTLKLINNRVFTPLDFHANQETGGVTFTREALKRYFVEYERLLNVEFLLPATNERTTLRKCFRLQAEKMATVIRDDAPYLPFSPEAG